MENLSAESKELLEGLNIEVPDAYLIPNHASSKVKKSPGEIFKSAYKNMRSIIREFELEGKEGNGGTVDLLADDGEVSEKAKKSGVHVRVQFHETRFRDGFIDRANMLKLNHHEILSS